MNKLFFAFFILILCFNNQKLSANQNPIYKSLEVGFSPISRLTKTQLGLKLFKLYQNAEIMPDDTYQRLKALSETKGFFDNPYNQFAYYRITHKLELSRGAPLKSEKAIKSLLKYGTDNNILWIIAEAKMWLATFHAKRSENELGLKLLEEVIPTAKNLNYLRLLGRAYNTRAILLSFQDKNYLAQQDYLKAFKIFKNYPTDPYLSKISSNLSVIFSDMEQWDKAQQYNNQAIAYYHLTDIKSSQQLASFHINAAYIEKHLVTGNTNFEQKKHLDLAFDYAKDSGVIRIIILVEIELSEYWLNKNQLDKSLGYAQECLKKSIQIQDVNSSGECALLEGRVYLTQQQYAKAETFLLDSLQYFNQSDSKISHHKAYEQLFKLYKTQNIYNKALEFKELFHNAKLQYLFNARNEKINLLEQRFASETKQQKIALLSAENELQTAKLEQQLFREKLWLICLILSFVFLYYLIKVHLNLKHSNAKLYYQSNHDALTGLFNRRYFKEQMSISSTNKLNKYSLAILDIDYFKRINDTYGHDIGDEVLVIIAKLLKEHTQENDFVTRWGGEEFIITFSNTNMSALKSTLTKIKDLVQGTKINTSSEEISLTLSIGVSPLIDATDFEHQWETALQSADTALYQAKHSGRNRIVFFK